MAASLADFNAPVKKPKLSDFFASGRQASPLLSPASINNVAAQTAAIDPSGDLNGTYVRVSDELNYGTSGLAQRVAQSFDELNRAKDQEALMSIATDPTLSVEQRASAINSFSVNGANRIQKSFFERTSMAAVMADSEPDDNDETEMVRLDTANVINEVDAYNGWVQKELNRMDALSNPGLLGTIANIIPMFVPFYEQIGAAQVSSKVFANEDGTPNAGAVAQALVLLGENKNAVRETIRALPADQRMELATKVMEIVRQSSGPGAFNENDIVMMNELRAYLDGTQSYGNDRLVDNIFSLLDSTIIAAPFARLAGKVGGGLSALNAGRVAKGVSSRAEDALRALNEAPVAADAAKVDAPLQIEFKPSSGDYMGQVDEAIGALGVDIKKTKMEGVKAEALDVIYSPTRPIDDIVAEVQNSILGKRRKMNETEEIDLRQRIFQIRENRNRTDFVPLDPSTSNVTRLRARTGVQPTSVSQAMNATNPAKARAMDTMMQNDNTGRAAEILYGTNKVDATGNNILPEVKNVDGSVRNKVQMDEAEPAPNLALIDEIKEARGDIHFKDSEKQGMRAKAKDDWRDIQGMSPRTAMSSVGDTDRGVSFDMVYGPKDGGFADANQAISQAKYALRKYGVVDDQIEVLKFDGTGYRPVTDWSQKGNYLIRVKHDYEFTPGDAISWSLYKNGNWKLFDTTLFGGDGSGGGLAQHLIPSTTYLDRVLIDAASVAADRSAWIMKRLLEMGNEYATKYKGLDAYQKALVDQYIVKANAEGLKFNTQALKAIGMTDKAVDAVRDWKRTQDTLYHFENLDVIKTLRGRGFMHYVDNAGTDLIVKPVHINQTGEARYVFDGEHVRSISRKEIQETYANGGTIAITRGANTWGDDTFEYVLVKNTSESSYLRQIADTDQILTYRDGYYTVRYNNPYFIRQKVVTKDGKTYWKAVATAGDRKLAEAELNRLRATDTKAEFDLSGDIKKNTDGYDDIQWESMVSNGRTAQRIRGERLKAAGPTESDINKLHIDTPEESLVKSIRSLSTRISHRDFIETSKKRYMAQFGHLMPKKNGLEQWASDVRDIGKNNLSAKRSEIADARATWRYIEAIDAGYVNLLDEASKNFFKGFSDTAGRMGWSWLEKGGRAAEEFGPTGFARKKAFRLLLAFNPLRQLPVQAMQALPVILATNPMGISRVANQFILLNYIARGGDVNSFFKAIAKQATGLTKEQAADLVKHYELSGFEASVKANSLIRDDMKGLVDRGFAQKAGRTLAKPGDFFQKIGFEAGENILMRSVWLSEYDRLLRSKGGKKIGMADLETLNAKVRHMTLNMNKAGELPYNENWLSAAMQFFQAPHKAFAQVVMGHKGLTTAERLKLGTLYVTTYGLGANWLTDMVGKLIPPEQKELKEALEGGLFNVLLNKTLSSVYGVDVRTDFSDSLRLLQVPNITQFVSDMASMQFGEMLTASPSASLVFGDSPRFTRFVKALMRPFTIENGWSSPDEYKNVGLTFLNLFSGGSNIWKAKYILEHQKQIGSMGQTIDWEANYVEAMLKAGGFATIDEVKYYALNDKTYKASQAFKDDISNFVKETSRRLSLQGISNQDAEYYLKVMAEAQRIYGNDPDATKEIMDAISFRASQNEGSIMETLYRLAPITSEEKMESMLNVAPIPEADKETIRQAIKIINEE